MTKMMCAIALYNLNRILSSRIKKHTLFYGIVVGISTGFIVVFSVVYMFTDIVESGSSYEEVVFYNCVTFLVVMTDVLFICLRFGAKTFIEQMHLTLFPIRIYRKILLNLMILTIDYRSIPYLALALLVFIKQTLQAHLVSAFMSASFILFLFINVTLWTYLLFFSAGSIMEKYRSNVIIFFTLSTVFYNAALVFKHGILITIVPLTSYAGTGVYIVAMGGMIESVFLLSLLVLDAAAGMLFLVSTYIRR